MAPLYPFLSLDNYGIQLTGRFSIGSMHDIAWEVGGRPWHLQNCCDNLSPYKTLQFSARWSTNNNILNGIKFPTVVTNNMWENVYPPPPKLYGCYILVDAWAISQGYMGWAFLHIGSYCWWRSISCECCHQHATTIWFGITRCLQCFICIVGNSPTGHSVDGGGRFWGFRWCYQW